MLWGISRSLTGLPRQRPVTNLHAWTLNFAVNDLDAFALCFQCKGVTILKREAGTTCKFASILDLDGTTIELWQLSIK